MQVDLNADLGESFGPWVLGDDAAMLGVVTSANIACGFHAGDPVTMRRACAAAVARDVAIGAQVSYPDLVGFGRRRMDLSRDELSAAVIYQIGALDAMARAAGDRVRYVKPHGALYHAAGVDPQQAGGIVDAILSYDPTLPLLGLSGSLLLEVAQLAGVTTVREAFADRAYARDGKLVSRGLAGAVITDPGEVAARVIAMVTTGSVEAIDGARVDVRPESICLHGDTPGAVGLAHAVREALRRADIAVAPFVAP